MKIAFFTDTFLPQINGVASSIANTAKVLGEKGHDVMIFTPNPEAVKRKKFKAKNVKIVELPSIPGEIYPEYKLSLFGYTKAHKYLKLFKPDLIHTHTPVAVGLSALILAKILKIPLVGTIHYFFVTPDYLDWFSNKLAIKIVRKLNAIIYNYNCFFYGKCNLRLSPSKKLILNLKNAGYKSTIKYLPNGVFLETTKPISLSKKAQLKKQYNLKGKVVLHFGRLSAEKKVDLVIKAFSKFSSKHQDISLLIIGDGPVKKSLVKLTEHLRVKDQVIFTGFIEHGKLISSGIIQTADVFVTASNMETHPMCVLEAMSFGLPIIGVNEAGLIELVSNNGFLVEYGNVQELANKIEEVILDDKLAQKLSKNSLKLAKQFSIENTTQQLIYMYRQILNKKRKINKEELQIKIGIMNNLGRWLSS